VEPVLKNKVSKDFLEMQWELPRPDQEYIISADWAKAQDFTVITVWNATHLPMHPIYQVRMRRRPYPVMIGAYNDLMRKYNADGIHDATGLGGVVADYIDKRAYGFMMTGTQRDNMLSDYIAAVENGKVKAPRVEVFYKAHLYCSVEDVYSRGKEFHLPDEVCSYALAWNLMSRRATPSEPIILPSMDDPNWMDHDMQVNHQRGTGSWTVGAVRNKTAEAEQEFNLMV
jgi:phage FluMu gp28-like protein